MFSEIQEPVSSIKSEFIEACRSCLATDVKLYNIQENHLTELFNMLTGNQITEIDGMPQHVCFYCRAMVFKFSKFRELCQTSQSLLSSALLEASVITLEFLKTIDRQFYNLSWPLTLEKSRNIDFTPDESALKTDYQVTECNNVDSDESKELSNVIINHQKSFNSIMTRSRLKQKVTKDNFENVEILKSLVEHELSIDVKAAAINENDDHDNFFDMSPHENYSELVDFKSIENDSILRAALCGSKTNKTSFSNLDESLNSKHHVETNTVVVNKRETRLRKEKTIASKKPNRKKEQLEKKEKKKTKKDSNVEKKPKKSNYETNEYWYWFEEEDKRTNFEEEFNYDIIVLTKEQQIEELQAKKLTHHYIYSPYKCDLCCRGFLEDVAYKNHIAAHELRKGDVKCEICGRTYRKKIQLKRHSFSHIVRMKCRQCGYTTFVKERAIDHYNMHRGHIFKCEHCEKTFRLRSNYYNHVRMLHPSKQLSCDLCGEGFRGAFGLTMHKRMIHDLEEALEKTSKNPCESCGVEFQNQNALRTHMESTPRGVRCTSLRACTECGENYPSTEHLNEHEETHKRQYQCEKCDMAFPNQASKDTHIERIHMNMKKKVRRKKACYNRTRAKTEIRACGKGKNIQLASGATEKKPRKKHAGGGGDNPLNVMCEICGKKFNCTGVLKVHQRTHTGDKPFQCSICTRGFTNKSYLQNHIRTHTGERPFQCKYCPKAFGKQVTLNIHQRVHTGEKPYCCPACGKCFSQSSSLRLHVMTVHQKLPPPYKNKKRQQTQQQDKMQTSFEMGHCYSAIDVGTVNCGQ